MEKRMENNLLAKGLWVKNARKKDIWECVCVRARVIDR